jgi:hypothetical protein
MVGVMSKLVPLLMIGILLPWSIYCLWTGKIPTRRAAIVRTQQPVEYWWEIFCFGGGIVVALFLLHAFAT